MKKHLFAIALIIVAIALIISGFTVYGDIEKESVEYVKLFAADGREELYPSYMRDAQLQVGWYQTKQDAAKSRILAEDVKALAAVMFVEARGLDTREVAMVGWCVLNRADRGDGTIPAICYSSQFALYHTNKAYHNNSDYAWLAEDILTRWYLEKMGETEVGRVLPRDFYWFTGDGRHNYFRNEFYGAKHLNSLFWMPNPYNQ